MSLAALTTLFVATVVAPPAVAWLRVAVDSDRPSRSRGTPSAGSLIDGHVMPPSGPGYVTYSYLGAALGRQYVHGAVRDTLLAAFAATATAPDSDGRSFQVAETGHRRGGAFPPHRTHRNGLSVDILVPVSDPAGRPAQLPTWPWNQLGYGWELDERGSVAGRYRLDFESLARLLLAIDREAAARHLRIERLILTPEYLPLLFSTPSGQKLGALRERFLKRQAWVRHDEHFHIDFERSGGSQSTD